MLERLPISQSNIALSTTTQSINTQSNITQSKIERQAVRIRPRRQASRNCAPRVVGVNTDHGGKSGATLSYLLNLLSAELLFFIVLF